MNQPGGRPIAIEDALGVCSVREDTRLLAEQAFAAVPAGMAPCRALDLGTGTGYVAIYLVLLGWQVDAVDVSNRALDLARHNAERNAAHVRVYRSDLYSDVEGPYAVIACNPPMRGDETEASRLLTATLRRFPPLGNLLMRLTQPLLERKRLGFLREIALGARSHLAPGGRLLLVISLLEEAELPALAPGLTLVASKPVRGIPGLRVATFKFDESDA